MTFSFALLLVPDLQLPASANTLKGRFELYCVDVGIFLTEIDGAPAPRKLALFFSPSFGAIQGRFPRDTWYDVSVYNDWCVPSKSKCQSVGHGKVWVDGPDPGPGAPPSKRISGKYEIDLNGKHLEGDFVAKEHNYKPVGVCE